MDDEDQGLGWLITDFKKRVVDVAHAIVVSADGIPLAVSDSIRPESVGKLCAITSGLVGLGIWILIRRSQEPPAPGNPPTGCAL